MNWNPLTLLCVGVLPLCWTHLGSQPPTEVAVKVDVTSAASSTQSLGFLGAEETANLGLFRPDESAVDRMLLMFQSTGFRTVYQTSGFCSAQNNGGETKCSSSATNPKCTVETGGTGTCSTMLAAGTCSTQSTAGGTCSVMGTTTTTNSCTSLKGGSCSAQTAGFCSATSSSKGNCSVVPTSGSPSCSSYGGTGQCSVMQQSAGTCTILPPGGGPASACSVQTVQTGDNQTGGCSVIHPDGTITPPSGGTCKGEG